MDDKKDSEEARNITTERVEAITFTSRDTTNSSNQEFQEIRAEKNQSGGQNETSVLDDDQDTYPTGIKLVLIILSLCLAVFLYGLDQSIIATAIPRITDDFKTVKDIGWYGSAYLLTASTFQLAFGRLYSLFPIKWVYLIALAVFELGSLICGAAPTSTALVVGRAIAGLGSAGLFSGSVLILTLAVPLRQRGAYTGLISAFFGLSTVLGPFLGGAFTDRVTWRLCFYINLPCGAITAAVVLFFVHSPPQEPSITSMTWWEKLKSVDVPGNFTLITSLICLLLALQLGGSLDSWNSAPVLIPLVFFVVLFVAFIAIEWYSSNYRLIPTSVLRNRSVVAASWFTSTFTGAFWIAVFYLPVYFQAVRGVSAFGSGVRTTPLMAGFVIFSILSGILTTMIGYYNPAMILGSILLSIAAGLLTTLGVSSSTSFWIGIQAIFGFGAGCGLQMGILVVQNVLKKQDVPLGVALITFLQNLGGAVGVSIAQNIFQNRLGANIHPVLPNLDTQEVIAVGATEISHLVPSSDLPLLLQAYSSSITQTLYISVSLGVISIAGSLMMEWKKMIKENSSQRGEC